MSEYGVALTLARYRAKQIVKDDWRRKGHKLAEVSAADVVGWAEDYIAANPQLIEQARATLIRWESERRAKVNKYVQNRKR